MQNIIFLFEYKLVCVILYNILRCYIYVIFNFNKVSDK